MCHFHLVPFVLSMHAHSCDGGLWTYFVEINAKSTHIKGDDLSISVPRHRVLFRLPRLLLLLQPQPTGACIPFADLEYKGSQKIAETLHLTLWASFAL